MTKVRWALLLGIVIIVAVYASRRVSEHHQPYRYCGAFVTGTTLVVFPFNASRETRIPLPFAPGRLTYGPDGKSLYSASMHWDVAPYLYRVDLNSGGMTPVPALSGFAMNSLAISRDGATALISGQYKASTQCGIFEAGITSDSVRKIALTEAPDCTYEDSWRNLSLSPDARFAVAERHGEIGLIDLAQGNVKSLGNGWQAAWSPDGKWIAISDHLSESDITLLSAGDLSVERRFAGGDTPGLAWSPDSRYLLMWKSCLLSLGYFGTLETVDIQSGRMQAIRSSRCAVNLTTEGWVSEDVIR